MSQQTNVSKVKKFILPYSTTETGKGSHRPDMELAAIYATAETDRQKGGILRHAKEEIGFIAKIGYPLWIFPYSNNVFLFDGLNVSEYSLSYADIGKINAFTNGLKNSSKNSENFTAFVAEQAKCFTEPNEKGSLELKGLLADPGFLQDFALHRQEASMEQGEFSLTGLLAPRVNELSLESIATEAVNLSSTFKKEAKELKDGIQLLGKASNTFHNEIQGQIKAVKEEIATEIKEEETVIAPQLKAIEQQYNDKTVDLARSIENKQVPLHSEIIKLKRSATEINQRIEKYNENAKSADQSISSGKEAWKLKIKSAREELLGTEKKIKSDEKAIEELDKKRASETAHLKAASEAEVRQTRSKIVEMESSRDAKILLMHQEIETLQKNTKILSDKIMKIIQSRETSIDNLQKIHMKTAPNGSDKAIFYVPHYVISYNSEQKRRYVSLPPSTLNTIGISTKIKGALGVTKIATCLSSRLKGMTVLGEAMEKLSRQDTIFETELKQLGEKNNILNVGWMGEMVEKGLLHLKEQGWLNDKEFGAIMATAKKDFKPHR